MNIYDYVQKVIAGEMELTSFEAKQIDGQSLVIAAFRQAKSGKSVKITLDPERGYLPTSFESLDPESKFHLMIMMKSARACSKGRWFPERILVAAGRPNERTSFKEIKVLELDADRRPKPEEFSFTIPAGTPVLNCKEPLKRFRVKQDERIDIESLPTLLEMTYEAQETPQFDTAIPRPGSHTWIWWAGGAIGLSSIGGLLAYRHRRKPAV